MLQRKKKTWHMDELSAKILLFLMILPTCCFRMDLLPQRSHVHLWFNLSLREKIVNLVIKENSCFAQACRILNTLFIWTGEVSCSMLRNNSATLTQLIWFRLPKINTNRKMELTWAISREILQGLSSMCSRLKMTLIKLLQPSPMSLVSSFHPISEK